MAQQVLVQRHDKSVVPALTAMALKGTNVNGRIHAIWTLEGLGALKVSTVTKLASDANPRIRIQALKASETLYKAGEKGLADVYNKALKDTDNEVVMQAIFSQKFLKIPEHESAIKTTLASNKSAGVKLIGEQIIAPPKSRNNAPFNGPELSKEQKGILERGELVFAELCSQCHGNDGMGKQMGDGKLLAPALAGSFRIQQHPEYAVRVILHGLEGAIEGKTYAGGLMQPMKEQSDQWISDVVSYIRNGLSNDASFVTPQQVAAIRANTNKQAGMYKFEWNLYRTKAGNSMLPTLHPLGWAGTLHLKVLSITRAGRREKRRRKTWYFRWNFHQNTCYPNSILPLPLVSKKG
jgi:mono/diheme cytochrome c family protein